MNRLLVRWIKPWTFCSCLAAFALMNAASYFFMSSGYGLRDVQDGIVAFGWPFVVLERGGIDGRHRVSWVLLGGNIAVALIISTLASFRWMMRKPQA